MWSTTRQTSEQNKKKFKAAYKAAYDDSLAVNMEDAIRLLQATFDIASQSPNPAMYHGIINARINALAPLIWKEKNVYL